MLWTIPSVKYIHLFLIQNAISQDTLTQINKSIVTYFAIYRFKFSKSITPKQHFLEKHCVPWLEQYGFGLGFHGEQGGELIHSSVARLERRGMSIRNEADQLRVIMKSQHLQTTPELLACAPPIKHRKRRAPTKE